MANPINSIKTGDRVTITNRFGQQRIGTAVKMQDVYSGGMGEGMHRTD